MEIKGKNIIVLGAGESGTGAAILAKKQGGNCFVSDYGQIQSHYKQRLIDAEIPFEEGMHSMDKILEADIVIKSPGISDAVALIKALEEKNILIIDEVELAAKCTRAKLIAVTGSNGKTTTTRLIYHILQTAGLDVGLAGNVGHSFALQVAEGDHDYYALELSSFQLDRCYDLAPDIMVLTNITTDHLDRYDYKLENYIAAKFRLVQNRKEGQLLVYNVDDEYSRCAMKQYLPFTEDSSHLVALTMNDGDKENLEMGSFSMLKQELSLKGRHNHFNMRAAVAVALELNIEHINIQKALSSFVNEAHRMEVVVEIEGVEYINDSKATNVDAVYYALEAMTKPIVWIVGGVDKGNDYSQLLNLVQEKVRAIVCLGKDNHKVIEAFKPIKDWIIETKSMSEAIKVASLYAEKGDVVLLSPACASFDLFENYKQRGASFKEILLHQHKILTEGITLELNFNINLNPSSQKTDRNEPWNPS